MRALSLSGGRPGTSGARSLAKPADLKLKVTRLITGPAR